jgi:hypothetical protein
MKRYSGLSQALQTRLYRCEPTQTKDLANAVDQGVKLLDAKGDATCDVLDLGFANHEIFKPPFKIGLELIEMILFLAKRP